MEKYENDAEFFANLNQHFEKEQRYEEYKKRKKEQEERERQKAEEQEEIIRQHTRTVMPPSLAKLFGFCILIIAIVVVSFIMALVKHAMNIITLGLLITIGGIMTVVAIGLFRSASNNRLKAFSGTIVNVDSRGIVRLNRYNLVTVESENGEVMNFRCADNKKFVVGNPVTFFIDKNSIAEETPDGPVSPFLSFQFSITDVKTVLPQKYKQEP